MGVQKCLKNGLEKNWKIFSKNVENHQKNVKNQLKHQLYQVFIVNKSIRKELKIPKRT